MAGTFYIDPVAVASDFGINVYADELVGGRLDPVESGMIEEEDNGKIAIYYDSLDHSNRQRFTIAHEIGHYVLGHLDGSQRMFRDTTKNYSLNNYNMQEAEANNFAAEMLMPKGKVDFLIKEKEIYSITELARLFMVSRVAMEYRLKKLGWIS